MPSLSDMDRQGLSLAFEQASKSYAEGGVPIGSALLESSDSGSGDTFRVLGASHNQRWQKKSATLHAEISALETAGRQPAEVYRKCTIYTTLSPCSMCTGAILLYKIPRVVVGESTNFVGGDDYLRENGVEVIVAEDSECKELMAKFIKEKPELWNEDIGVVS